MTDEAGSTRPDHFALDETAMRELGYRVIDMIVEHRAGIRDKPVGRRRTRAELNLVLGEALPESGTDPAQVLRMVGEEILTGIAHTDHPRFFGYVPSPGNYISVLGDALSAGFNVFAGHCLVGSSAAAIEAITLGWLRSLMDLPSTASGIFLSGGSMAGLSALHSARTWVIGSDGGHDDRLVVYGTDETHSSLAKALRILGFSPRQFRRIATDEALRMDMASLRAAIEADRERGLRPFAVVATAGTTSTGAIDPLDEIRRICDDHALWMHVDGAYGAAAKIGSRGGALLTMLGRADSLVLDPHKWWFQPYEIGCLFVRDGKTLKEAFSFEAEYLREAASAAVSGEADGLSGDINFYDQGPQLTRSFRALKLWMFMKTFGVQAMREAIDRGVALAEAAERHIDESPAWEIVTPAQIGILTFRASRAEWRARDMIKQAVAAMLEDGFALITTTEVRGETVFRLCLIHPDAALGEVEEALSRLETFHTI
jgi:aromatic-L-amino-acid decarboxylase